MSLSTSDSGGSGTVECLSSADSAAYLVERLLSSIRVPPFQSSPNHIPTPIPAPESSSTVADNLEVKWAKINSVPLIQSQCVQPKPRHGHRAVAYRHCMIVFGGGNEGIMDELHVFDTLSNAWFQPSIQGDIPPGCAAYGLVVDNHRIILFGGMTEYGHYSNNLYELSPARWEWRKLKAIGSNGCKPPCPRMGHSFTIIEDKVFLFGGLTNDTGDPAMIIPRFLNDMYILHLRLNNWNGAWDQPITFGSSPGPRESHTAVAHISKDNVFKKLIVYGGMSWGLRMGDLYVLDIDTNMWCKPDVTGTIPSPRSLHTAALVGDNMYIFGGWVPKPAKDIKSGDSGCKPTNSLACLNVNTLTWKNIHQDILDEKVPKARAGHSAVVINTRIYFWSGRDGLNRVSNNQVCFEELWQLEVKKPDDPGKVQLIRAGTDWLEVGWKAVPGAYSYILQCLPYEVSSDPIIHPEPTQPIHSMVPLPAPPPINSMVPPQPPPRIQSMTHPPATLALPPIQSMAHPPATLALPPIQSMAHPPVLPPIQSIAHPPVLPPIESIAHAPATPQIQSMAHPPAPLPLIDHISKFIRPDPAPSSAFKPQVTTALQVTTTTPVQIPVCSTLSQVPSTQAPVPLTHAPVSLTQAPVSLTQAPVSLTQAPVHTTQAPVPTTQAPVPSTQVTKNTSCVVKYYFDANEQLSRFEADTSISMGKEDEEELVKKNHHLRLRLKPATAYKFRVAAINSCGKGPWGEVTAFKTCQPGFPGVPNSVKISKCIGGAAITWEPPSNSGEMLEYSVYLVVKPVKAASELKAGVANPNLSFLRVYCGQLNKCHVSAKYLDQALVNTLSNPAIIFRIAAKNSKGYGPATQVRWLQDSTFRSNAK